MCNQQIKKVMSFPEHFTIEMFDGQAEKVGIWAAQRAREDAQEVRHQDVLECLMTR